MYKIRHSSLSTDLQLYSWFDFLQACFGYRGHEQGVQDIPEGTGGVQGISVN
ncbi:polyadenylate-binding protein 4 [Platysternon megacephalum]|uniref:Polyadenylate-binding protein 4 n=1 Tax=Platysternon megacephalum TaxID=55544 RepID=A0A4D9EYZ4_9SAUR|nr:polyadenylate-binding protein 4 [Platysternon megacephalum]